MKILFIDDQPESAQEIIDTLGEIYTLDEPLIRQNPHDGIRMANHSFDYFFIDLRLGIKNLNGADVGLQIRKKCPLTPMILVTAHGPENIMDFIHVGFDAYIEKEKSLSDWNKYKAYLKNAISKSEANSQRRIKSKFEEEDLKHAQNRLDCMEKAFELGRGVEFIAAVTGLFEKEIEENDIKKDIENIMEEKKRKGYTYQGHKILSSQAINDYLKVYSEDKETGEKRFSAKESALKVRQLIKDNPDEWGNLKSKHATVKSFLRDFDLT